MSETAGPDPYQLSADAVKSPPASFGQILRQIGPGLILTASIVGTGELIATTNLGAKAGFLLLWLVLLSCFIKVFVQIELGRYAISSGHTTLASFHQVPRVGGVLSWWWAIMTMCTQFQIGAMIGATGYCVHMGAPALSNGLVNFVGGIMPSAHPYLQTHPELPWALLITVVTIFLLVVGRYIVVEKVCTLLVALFTLLTVCCMLMLPWAELPPEEAAAPIQLDIQSIFVAAFAMIGITGVGAAELISYPYWCLEKRYARFIGPRDESESWTFRARGWLKVMLTDAWLSMVIYTLATIAFYVLGAAVLFRHTGGRGLSGNARDMLGELARMYEPVLGRSGSIWFIAIGGFIVLYSTLFAATAGNSRVATDFLRVQKLIPFLPSEYRERWVRLFSAAIPILGLVLFIGVQDPVAMVIFGGVAQALTLPMIAAVAIFLRLRRTDRRLVKIGVWDVLLWLSLVMFAVAAAYGIFGQISKLFTNS